MESTKIPKIFGPFSPAKVVKCGDSTSYAWTSGHLGQKPETGMLVSEDVSEQTKQALTNLQHLLEDNNSSLKRVMKTTVYLTSMDDFAAVNGVYKQFFTDDFPARSCIAVQGLPSNAKVEIEATVVNQ